jgi:enoyl-CoA hydratase/carnithine racemase
MMSSITWEAAHLRILTGAGDKAFVAGADISEMTNDTPLGREDAPRASGHEPHPPRNVFGMLRLSSVG